MQIFRQLSDVPRDPEPCIATIGNFDGVHLGHRHIIESVIGSARERQRRALAITFDPHPSRALRPTLSQPMITPLEQKLALLAQTGLHAAVVLPFTDDLARMSARDFAKSVLREALGVEELHEGENFRFGYQAEADVNALERFGKEFGFALRKYVPQTSHKEPISSSRIRSLIGAGKLNEARWLLGRPFAIESTPASGRGYGTRYAVPTINLAPYNELLPANGVYVSTLSFGTGASKELFQAVTNVGNRPTFGEDSFAVESHIFNFHPISLDESTPVELTFLHRLRAEIRWPDTESLRRQITRDVDAAKRYFELRRLVTKPLTAASHES